MFPGIGDIGGLLPSGGSSGGGIGFPSGGPSFGINLPTLNIGLGGSSTPSTSNASLGGSALSAASSLFGLSLSRIAFFLIGLICIIGAIYLYKDTRFMITAPINAAKTAAKTATAAASTAE